jgi:hypothetical protein
VDAVSLFVKLDSQPLEIIADARPYFPRVLSDAAGKHDRISAIHRCQIRANVFADTITKDVNRETRTSVVFFTLFCKQFSHVAC